MITDALRILLAVNPPIGCKHNPIVLDESPNSAAPSLVVCSLCGEVLDGEAHQGAQRESNLAAMKPVGSVQ